ncbi:hypothetical protein TWF694_007530 [Orbilia ellipsospora]|uniref:MaoC-like domain-containing protein n=1 Tax=Orbilia ellipsospora TaxID=2528407 RepID=A0AAV9XIW4_9PEZI
MVLPLLLRPARRLVIHPRIPTVPSRLIFRHPIQARRWNSVAALVAERHKNLLVNKEAAPDNDSSMDTQVEEHIKNLPAEARELLTRQFPLIQDFIGPSHSHLLTLTLQPYLNFSDIKPSVPGDENAPHNPFTIKNILPYYGVRLPPGYHFAYFNGYTQESELSADGYISAQSPGGTWTRRMWAGGKLTFQPMPEKRRKGYDRGARRARPLDIGRRALCHESIEDIQMKGEPGSDNEMMFVYIRRKIWAEGYIVREPTKSPKLLDVPQPEETELLVLPDEEVPLIEQRCLVYMKEKPKADPTTTKDEPAKPSTAKVEEKSRSRADKAEFKHSFTPTPTLLFRYSALTFNAHKIHIDKQYAKDQEGHRDLIVHGPLTITFLLEFLRNHMLGLEKEWRLNTFEYRNVAPLYVNEPVHLYGRFIPDAPTPVIEPEADPRERLLPMYDEMDNLRKQLKEISKRADPNIPEEEYLQMKKEARRALRRLKGESEKLEKFHPVEQREVEYKVFELWAENDKGQVAIRGTALIEDLPTKPELTPEQQWKRYQAQMDRNKRLLQRQQLKEHKTMVRKKRQERKEKLRSEQKERDRVRREEKERLWRDARAAMLKGEEAGAPMNDEEDEREDLVHNDEEDESNWDVEDGEENDSESDSESGSDSESDSESSESDSESDEDDRDYEESKVRRDGK